MSSLLDWSGSNGDSWARLWPDTDRALGELALVLDAAILSAAPPGTFRALDVGCGAGSTTIALAEARPDARIVAVDLSPALIETSRTRTRGLANVEVEFGDAVAVAARRGPFDLIFSRHGVMFFDDPAAAFVTLRESAAPAGQLIFSCFRDWTANRWASDLSEAAAGRPVAPPGREPSGFAFAEPDYVSGLLTGAGWSDVAFRPIDFCYVAGEGVDAVDQALAFLSTIGPASSVLRSLQEHERAAATARMRSALERDCHEGRVEFQAAAWIWSGVAR
jgi:SAM-dependent methyltransferase